MNAANCSTTLNLKLLQHGEINKVTNNRSMEQSSIYQYTLLRKVRITPWMRALYILLLTGCLMFLLSRESMVMCLIVLALVCILQLLFKWTALRWNYPGLAKRWTFSIRLPFSGLVPQQPVLLTNYRSIEWHASLAGLFLVGSIAIWLPLNAVAAVVGVWLMIQLPSIVPLLFRVKSSDSSVSVKLQSDAISYYRA